MNVGGSGIPPIYGFQFFTAGLDNYLKPIEDEYFCSYINNGGSAFKLVVGTFGGGKTHFLYSVRELAWKNNLAVSYVQLTEKTTPFNQLEAVYRSIVANIMFPMTGEELLSGREKGIESFIKVWYQNKINDFKKLGVLDAEMDAEIKNYLASITTDSSSFTNAIKAAFNCLFNKQDDDFSMVIQWLKGEPYNTSKTDGPAKFKIQQRIDKNTAFTMIASLVQWVRSTGYLGLVILFDEAEQTPSMSGKQKTSLLQNLLELINECAHGSLPNCMIFYAVPNLTFLDGKTDMFVALNQRLETIFEPINYQGVRIDLGNTSSDSTGILIEIGMKLAKVYEIANSITFNKEPLENSISALAKAVIKDKWGDTGFKREFVQKVIKAFGILRINPDQAVTPDKVGL